MKFMRGALLGAVMMLPVAAGCPVLVVVDESADPCLDVSCGEGASCLGDGVCVCEAGYIGDPDEQCNPVQELWITDECPDGESIHWRVFAQERGWAWPSADEVFVTLGLSVTTAEQLECLEGELLCFGAAAGGDPQAPQWGVGLDGTGDCEDCCFACAADVYDLGAMICD